MKNRKQNGEDRKLESIILTGIFLVVIFSGCTKISSSEKDKITFSHQFHLEQGLECLNCHEGIQSSEAVGFGLPSMDVCAQCHSETQESENCTKCHSNPSSAKKLTLRTIALNFSHKNHMERVNNDCTACHITVIKSTQVKDDNIPSMDSCTSCHSATLRELKCSQCHTNLGSYDLKPIMHMSHKGNFIKGHQEFARADISVCAQCHQESFCSDCHAKTEGLKASIKFPESEHRAFIHRGDWLSRHPLEARADQNKCLKCHDLKKCIECHEKVSAEPARSMEPGHPKGWGEPASPDFHGRVARRDIALCAACHDQGENSICVECHRTDRLKVNIHPKGFKSSLDKKKNKMCAVCHK